MRPWTARACSAGVDAVCLALFVALGRASHDISSGITWYVTVLWPFLVGWFGVALVVRLYKSPLDRWVMLTCAWVGGTAIALGLRAELFQLLHGGIHGGFYFQVEPADHVFLRQTELQALDVARQRGGIIRNRLRHARRIAQIVSAQHPQQRR